MFKPHFTQLRYLLNRLSERLWVKPAIACVLSVAGVFLARYVDTIEIDWEIPEIAQDSVIDLLEVIAASMLGVATFAVASMVAAYASAGQSATARAFPLIVADDVSQNALSAFIAAFIFSIVALSATTNDYYGKAGRFTLFVLTLLVLALVVLVFVRWVDRIARLGRLGAVIAKVEKATGDAMARRKCAPYLGGLAATGPACGLAFYSDQSGYLQRVDMAALQKIASQCKFKVTLAVLPGSMIVPSRPLGYVVPDSPKSGPLEPTPLSKAFIIGPMRQFDDDPRFGLVVLAEIACRSLSPGINDPGTAVGILSAMHRLFDKWPRHRQSDGPTYDRVEAQALLITDMFDDAFPALARDGAGMIEVAERMQRLLGELAYCDDGEMQLAASRHAAMALARSERALDFAPDLNRLRRRHADFWVRVPFQHDYVPRRVAPSAVPRLPADPYGNVDE